MKPVFKTIIATIASVFVMQLSVYAQNANDQKSAPAAFILFEKGTVYLNNL